MWSFRHDGKKYPFDKVCRDRILELVEREWEGESVPPPPRYNVADRTWSLEQEYCEQALLDRWIDAAKQEKVKR